MYKIIYLLRRYLLFLEFVLPETVLVKLGVTSATHSAISDGLIAVGTMAFGLGLIDLLLLHGSKIAFKRKGAMFSVALLIGLGAMLAVTIADWRGSSKISTDVDRLFQLRDFAGIVQRDFAEGTAGVLPATQRNQKLVAAVRELLPGLKKPVPKHDTSDLNAERLRKLQTKFDALLQQADQHLSALPVTPEREPQRATGKTSYVVEYLPENTSLMTYLTELGGKRRELLDLSYESSLVKRLYNLLFEGLFVALGSAMFSLLGFYIATAAYRAFRIKSWESSLMMLAALLVMLGQIPFGLWIWEGFPGVRLWLLQTPNSAAFRAIKIGVSIAFLIMAFRMWLSIESETFADDAVEGGA